MGLAADVVVNYPKVVLFFNGGPVRGAHETRLLISNGEHLLCADDDGSVFLVSLRDIVKVSPCSDDRFHCTYDFGRGRITYRDRRTGRSSETGPLRGAPDPSVSVQRFATGLGLKWCDVVSAPLPALNIKHCDGFVAGRSADGVPAETVTVDAIVGAIQLDDLEAFAVPDLPSMDLSAALPAVRIKSPPHRGRIDPAPED